VAQAPSLRKTLLTNVKTFASYCNFMFESVSSLVIDGEQQILCFFQHENQLEKPVNNLKGHSQEKIHMFFLVRFSREY